MNININNNATSSPYSWHNSNKVDTDKEANRQSIVGFIGADSKSKKRNRCFCCSRTWRVGMVRSGGLRRVMN